MSAIIPACVTNSPTFRAAFTPSSSSFGTRSPHAPLKDLGFIPIWPNPATNVSPRTVEAIRSLKMNHRRKHPLMDGSGKP